MAWRFAHSGRRWAWEGVICVFLLCRGGISGRLGVWRPGRVDPTREVVKGIRKGEHVMSACMHRTRLAAACVPLALVAAANGQILSDGDFEALSVGTPPDCAAPAGAWAWPAN